MTLPTTNSQTIPLAVHRPVLAVVLAAGLSRRMGSVNKLLQNVEGEPMLRQVTRHLLASRCDRVAVIVGYEADLVRDALTGLSVDFVQNPDFHEGMAASVRAAADAARQGEAILICLGDMPYVSTEIVNAIVDAYRATASEEEVAAFQPLFEGRSGNPVLWAPHTVSLLKDLEGDEGARGILKRLGNAVRPVPVQHDGIFLDIDTPEMLAQVRESRK